MKFAYINILYTVNAQSAKIGQESMHGNHLYARGGVRLEAE
jgi:hypothetical protein